MTDIVALDEVAGLCRAAASSEHDLLIAGEGNASLTTDDGRLFVTRSGARLGSLEAADFTEVDRDALLHGMAAAEDDAQWRDRIAAAVAPGSARPTVEVGLHACYSAALGPGVVLHTHPTAVLGLMVRGRGAELAAVRLLPDHVVMCGATSWYLEYTDPGLTLARVVRDRLRAATEAEREVPNVLHLGNHGVVVTARTAQAALDVTLMVTKSARILAGADQPRAMTAVDIARITGREDEHHRRRLLGLTAPEAG